MKQFILYTLLFFFNAQAQQNSHLFEEAHGFFKQNRIAEAFELYEKLYLQGHDQANLLYNLGTSALKLYRLKETPEAIAKAQYFLQLARDRKPLDRDIHHNLKIVSQSMGEEIDSGWSVWLSSHRPWVFLIHLLVFSLSITLFVFSWKRSRLKRSDIIHLGAYLLMISSLTIIYFLQRSPLEEELAVIKTNTGILYSEPVETSTSLLSLPPGSTLKVAGENQQWLKIDLGAERVGWILAKHCIYQYKKNRTL